MYQKNQKNIKKKLLQAALERVLLEANKVSHTGVAARSLLTLLTEDAMRGLVLYVSIWFQELLVKIKVIIYNTVSNP